MHVSLQNPLLHHPLDGTSQVPMALIFWQVPGFVPRQRFCPPAHPKREEGMGLPPKICGFYPCPGVKPNGEGNRGVSSIKPHALGFWDRVKLWGFGSQGAGDAHWGAVGESGAELSAPCVCLSPEQSQGQAQPGNIISRQVAASLKHHVISLRVRRWSIWRSRD